MDDDDDVFSAAVASVSDVGDDPTEGLLLSPLTQDPARLADMFAVAAEEGLLPPIPDSARLDDMFAVDTEEGLLPPIPDHIDSATAVDADSPTRRKRAKLTDGHGGKKKYRIWSEEDDKILIKVYNYYKRHAGYMDQGLWETIAAELSSPEVLNREIGGESARRRYYRLLGGRATTREGLERREDGGRLSEPDDRYSEPNLPTPPPTAVTRPVLDSPQQVDFSGIPTSDLFHRLPPPTRPVLDSSQQTQPEPEPAPLAPPPSPALGAAHYVNEYGGSRLLWTADEDKSLEDTTNHYRNLPRGQGRGGPLWEQVASRLSEVLGRKITETAARERLRRVEKGKKKVNRQTQPEPPPPPLAPQPEPAPAPVRPSLPPSESRPSEGQPVGLPVGLPLPQTLEASTSQLDDGDKGSVRYAAMKHYPYVIMNKNKSKNKSKNITKKKITKKKHFKNKRSSKRHSKKKRSKKRNTRNQRGGDTLEYFVQGRGWVSGSITYNGDGSITVDGNNIKCKGHYKDGNVWAFEQPGGEIEYIRPEDPSNMADLLTNWGC